jgi:hypothetical protein
MADFVAPASNVQGYKLIQTPVSSAILGDNTIIAAQGVNRVICIHHLFLSANAAVVIDITAGAGGAVILENIKLADTGGFEMGPWDHVLFGVPANTALVFNASAATAVYGSISYTVRDL